MNILGQPDRGAMLADALKGAACSIQPETHNRWAFCFGNGSGFQGVATSEREWLILEVGALVPPRRVEELGDVTWDLLKRNASLPGSVKFVLSPANVPVARAEISLDEEVDLHSEVKRACGHLACACRVLSGEMNVPHAMQHDVESDDAPGEWTAATQAACEEIGWPVAEREADLVVELDVPHDFQQATLQAVRGRGMRASVELLTCEDLSLTCRRAMGAFLLRATRLVRLVRAVAEDDGGETVVRLEGGLASPGSAIEIMHLLNALSVACRVSSQEVSALRSEEIAHLYLTATYPSLAEQGNVRTTDGRKLNRRIWKGKTS